MIGCDRQIRWMGLLLGLLFACEGSDTRGTSGRETPPGGTDNGDGDTNSDGPGGGTDDGETETDTASGGGTDDPFVPGDSRLDGITRPCGSELPSRLSGGQSGWGSRYWDCCKPHCAWLTNVNNDTSRLVKNCDQNDVEIAAVEIIHHEYWTEERTTPSGCQEDNGAFTCYDHSPFAVCDRLAYGFAAVPLGGPDVCGKCFQLDFDGGFEHGVPRAGHRAMEGKTMIVMASNTGGDVGAGQFDIMIPGGGLGIFRDGCARQWNVNVQDESLVGSSHGGFSTYCMNTLPGGEDAPLASIQSCVRTMCDDLFGTHSSLRYLREGCYFYVDWMYAVNNPTFTYAEVNCPQALIDLYASSF